MGRLPIVTTFARATSRKRLWLGGGALATFLLVLLVGNRFAGDRGVGRADLGHDFLAFYTAAEFVRDGRGRQLYDLDAVRRAEQATARAVGINFGNEFGPWWNPPAYALALSPLARLPYAIALDVWWAINAAAVCGAVVLLVNVVHRSVAPDVHPGLRSAALVPLLLLTSMPLVQAMSHGQNTPTSLLLLTATSVLWRAGRSTAAGLVGGLLFYKPQLAAVLAAVLTVDLGRRALGGLAITGAAHLLVTVVALPGTLGDWVHRLPANVRFMQVDRPYLWDRHVTLKAFWRLLFQGTAAGPATAMTTAVTVASVSLLAAALMRAAWRARGRAECRDRLIAATVAATPLLMPFYFDYDLLLLAVPLTLYAVDRQRQRWLTGAWVGLYAVLFVNAPIAGRTHVVPATALLTAAAMLSIRRVTAVAVAAEPSLHLPRLTPLARAA